MITLLHISFWAYCWFGLKFGAAYATALGVRDVGSGVYKTLQRERRVRYLRRLYALTDNDARRLHEQESR